jgi:hypothetical protein
MRKSGLAGTPTSNPARKGYFFGEFINVVKEGKIHE